MDAVNNGLSTEHRDALGRYTNGNPGRVKGSKNLLREKVKTFVNTNIESLQLWFDSLEPEKKIKVLNDLMPFCISKLQSITESDDEGNPVEKGVTVDWTRLSEPALKEVLSLIKINNNGNETL